MRLNQDIAFTPLAWVKPELDETLRLARRALEDHVETPDDAAAMRYCASHLHQVTGTLRMLELHGATLVAEEMERLAGGIVEDRVGDREEAYTALMRAIVQLPDYLERIQAGFRDIPLVLLPLLNELRAARGEPGIPESRLFAPDLQRPLPGDSGAVATQPPETSLRERAEGLLARYRDGRRAWEGGEADGLADMADACDALLGAVRHEPVRRLWWVATGVLRGLCAGAVEAPDALRQALGAIEEFLARFAEGGEDALDHEAAQALTRELLYFVAHAAAGDPHLDALRDAFELDAYLPEPRELEHARQSMSGRNQALLGTVASAIKDDLLRVKDALDLHIRQPNAPVAALADQLDVLSSVADTLDMLSLTTPRRVVLEQHKLLQDVVEGRRPAEESTLLDIAGALLYVEASLDDQVLQLGGESDDSAPQPAERPLPASEARQVLDSLVREALANFAQARQCFVAFIETGWDRAQLADVPPLLEEVAGALRILQIDEAPRYLDALAQLTRTRLIEGARLPDAAELDTLADALASLEYYLEAVHERRGGRTQILETARSRLGRLGVDLEAIEATADTASAAAVPVPQPAEAAPVEMAAIEPGEEAAAAAAESEPAAESGPRVPAPPPHEPVVEAPPPVPAHAHTGFEASDQAIDDDIREVFLEEVEEELRNFDNLMAPWREAPGDLDRLRPIRRIFHTLKGSGRLVGALTLGEFAWRIENALNQALDGHRPVSPALVGLLDEARKCLPALRDMLTGEPVDLAPVRAVQSLADRIAAGEDVFLDEVAPVAAPEAGPEPAPVASEPVEVAEAAEAEPEAEEEEGGIPVAIDAVLLEILLAEVEGHLETVRDWLAECEPEPVAATESLLRAVHTINGALAMAEVPVLPELTTPLEGCVRRLLATASAASSEGVALIAEAADCLERACTRLARPAPRLADPGDLPQRLQALRDSLPEPPPPVPETLEALDEEDEEAMWPEVALPEAPDFAALPEAGAEPAEAGEDTEEAPGTIDEEEWAAILDETGSGPIDFEESETSAGEEPEELLDEDSLDELERMIQAFAESGEDEPSPDEELPAEGGADTSEAIAPETGELEDEPEAGGAGFEAPDTAVAAAGPEPEEEAGETEEAAGTGEARGGLVYTPEELAELEALFAAEAAEHATTGTEPEAVPGTQPPDSVEPGPETAAATESEPEAEAADESAPEPVAADPAQPEPIATEQTEPEPVAAAEPAPEAPTDAPEQPAAVAEAVEEPAVEEPAVEEPAVEEPPAEATPVPATVEDPDPDQPLDVSDLDLELLDIFIQESHDLLDSADTLVARLREAPGEAETIAGLQRDLHTLKGGARMAGIMPIGELGHVMESLLEVVADGRRELDHDGVRLLEAGLDRLHAMLQRVSERRALAVPATLIARFDALARGQAYTRREETEAAAEAAPPLAPLSQPLPEEDLPVEDEAAGVRAPQEQVRIRADLLDRLVNYAGEVAIYRARLEQQLGGFRSNLNELEQTNTRLRDQLRKLEIETEAQIMARFQRESDAGDPEFDPLELDRFSTLQQLTRALAESAADLTSLQTTLEDLTRQYETLLQQQSRVSTDLQEGLMRTRMVPFEALVPRLRRVLRQAAGELGKQAQLRVEGAQGEMDRSVLDRMTAPLEHMLRNAVAHGLETPAERKRARKPEEGTVTLAVSREGSEVVIVVTDDGRGLDAEAIRRKAIERGRLRPEAEISRNDLYAFILETGFSTATEVSRLAGRGVGMDVVYNEIRQLGGALQIDSEPGAGTRFTIRLPFSMAVTQAVFVRIGETTHAVPIASVRGVGRIARDQLNRELAEGRAAYRYAGEEFVIHDLGVLLDQGPVRASESLQLPLLLIQSGELRAAVLVDQVLGNREIVVKPVGPQVSSIPGVFGATILGDGSVVVILDVAPLVRRHASLAEGNRPRLAPVQVQPRVVPLVMVVDDSITMRKVTGRVLERHNLEVVTAKDGVDAIEKMAERVPDLMLLDVEMPRMDGYELATHMRADPRLREVPIVIITSRTGEKHRQRAFEVGVDDYLGKPYQESELMKHVSDLLRGRKGGG